MASDSRREEAIRAALTDRLRRGLHHSLRERIPIATIVDDLTAAVLSLPDPEKDRLREAIREHRAAINEAGAIGGSDQLDDWQLDIAERKHEADRKLWAALSEPSPSSGESEGQR